VSEDEAGGVATRSARRLRHREGGHLPGCGFWRDPRGLLVASSDRGRVAARRAPAAHEGAGLQRETQPFGHARSTCWPRPRENRRRHRPVEHDRRDDEDHYAARRVSA